MFCGVVYGLGHTIVRLFGSEQARQRAVKGGRRNFIAVGITIHPQPTKRYTALKKCGFYLGLLPFWLFDNGVFQNGLFL